MCLKKMALLEEKEEIQKGVPNTQTQGRFFLTVTADGADGVHILRHQHLLTAPFTPSASAESAISIC